MTGPLRPALIRPLALVGAVVLLLLALPQAWATSAMPPASTADAIAADLFDRLNDERGARGLPPLRWDPQLARLASDWSGRMSSTGAYEHNDLARVMRDPAYADRWSGLGENIHQVLPASSTAGRAHLDWMRSDGHRLNMLNAGYDAVGIGVVCDGDGRMWATQNFGRGRASQGPGHDRSAPAAEPVRRGDSGGASCDDHLHGRHGADWPPSASLTASHVRADALTVEWSAAQRNVHAYRVEVDAGRGFEAVATVGPGTRTYQLTRLSADTSYRIRVQARDARARYHVGPDLRVRTQRRPTVTEGIPTWSASPPPPAPAATAPTTPAAPGADASDAVAAVVAAVAGPAVSPVPTSAAPLDIPTRTAAPTAPATTGGRAAGPSDPVMQPEAAATAELEVRGEPAVGATAVGAELGIRLP